MKTKRLLLSAIIFITVLALFPLSAPAEENEKEIVATGMADGTDAKARDEAIDDALRQAVKQGMGSFVSSETLVENMILVEDRIYSETRGYINSYKVIKEKAADKYYSVKISAVVRLSKLGDDLESIGLLIRKKRNPRVMVVLHSREIASSWFEYVRDGNRNLENRIESALMRKGFKVVDAGQVARKKKVEVALSGNDYSSAAKIAKDFGAEVLISGDVRRTYVNSRHLYGRNVKFYSNEIRLKAIEADTARVLYSGSGTKPASAIDYLEPLEEASSELTGEMISGILDQWSKDVYQIASYTVNLSGAGYSDISKLKKELQKVRGFGGMQTRSFQSGNASLEVKYRGPLEELADRISQIKDLPMEITGLQSNTLEIKVNK